MPGLYVVAMPIGNLEDVTFRALKVLKEADLIACEDTRSIQPLLKTYDIKTPLISYHKFNLSQRNASILYKIKEGKTIALVSDAGTPGISDPGEELVSVCLKEKLPVFHIPGACALIHGLVLSGFSTKNFSFFGFLSAKGKERSQDLKKISKEEKTFILYEAPHRLLKTLKDLAIILGGETRIAIGRELTKKYEEFFRGTISAAQKYFTEKKPRGEFVLILEPPIKGSAKPLLSAEIIDGFLREKLPIKQSARLLAAAFKIPKNQAYALLIRK